MSKNGLLQIKADSLKMCIEMKKQFKKQKITKYGQNEFRTSIKFGLKDYYQGTIQYTCTKEKMDQVNEKFVKSDNKGTIIKQREPILNPQDNSKKQLGIRITKSEKKRCSSCDYYKKNRCGLFELSVNPNDICKRYHKTYYRVLQGGGFSPR